MSTGYTVWYMYMNVHLVHERLQYTIHYTQANFNDFCCALTARGGLLTAPPTPPLPDPVPDELIDGLLTTDVSNEDLLGLLLLNLGLATEYKKIIECKTAAEPNFKKKEITFWYFDLLGSVERQQNG